MNEREKPILIKSCSCEAYKLEIDNLTKERDDLAGKVKELEKGIRKIADWEEGCLCESDDCIFAFAMKLLSNDEFSRRRKGSEGEK